jgi:hypothetical protein
VLNRTSNYSADKPRAAVGENMIKHQHDPPTRPRNRIRELSDASVPLQVRRPRFHLQRIRRPLSTQLRLDAWRERQAVFSVSNKVNLSISVGQ